MNPPNSLSHLFASAGHPCQARTGAPLCLHGSGALWLVSVGKVDLFLARMRDGHPESALHPLFRVATGQLLCAMPESAAAEGWQLVATGVPGNQLQRLERTQVQVLNQQDPAAAGQLAELLAHWRGQLTSSLAAPPAANATLPESAAAACREETNEADLRCQAESWAQLDAFHATLLAGLIAQVDSTDQEEQQRLQRKAANEAQNIRGAMHRLAGILDQDGGAPAIEEGETIPLLAACRLVGSASGIVFEPPPPDSNRDLVKRDRLREIVDASRVRQRQVALKGDWWNQDNGNLLGFIEDGKKPVALLQTAHGYSLHDPLLGTVHPLTAEVAGELLPFAFTFCRAFGDSVVNLLQMLKFGNHGNGRDILMAMAMGVAVGLLGLVTPLATGMLFDTVIPGAEKDQLVQLTLALLAGAFASAMFEVSRGFAMLRAEGKMDSAVQSAVWDRLLRLPATFFRDYSAGDLAMRASGINTIRQALSGNALHAMFSAVFSIFNLVLLFYFSAKLALLGLALVAVAILFTAAASYLSLRHTRRLSDIEGQISGLVFQLLGSVAKLRTTGAESRAFFNWATLFARQQEHRFKATMANNLLVVFNSVFPTLASMAIFLAIALFLAEDKTFSTGTFLAFNAAFGAFMGAMLGATAVLTSVLGVIPMYERAKPILQTAPEITESKAYPGQLNGDIEISHLNFSYTPDSPKILTDLSLHIKSGEFVALVGSSGAGKSTLLRLLLGFEIPSSGSIYYDRQDISGIDLGALRRQLGVVLQDGQLLSGDIFTNIIGSAASLSVDDAWAAATQAGIADDIRDMPMGMYTVVSDGGGTLSGGQRQRLLIARAIVNRPRILFFDEATSALDNRAQEMVSASLENLRATRIVIAHRLSTIIRADRIFVLDGGKLAQTGTYDELISVKGLFADLARRQIV